MARGRDTDKEIDLHGLPEAEAIRKFVREYNAYVRSGGRNPVRVIHGYGSSGKGGVIQRTIRRYVTTNAGRFDRVVEGDSLANPGITLVYPRRLLPEGSGTRP